MVRNIKIRLVDQDDELGIKKKEINFPNKSLIETPSKSFSAPGTSWKKYSPEKIGLLDVNEVSKRFDEELIDSLGVNSSVIKKDIERLYVPNKINMFISNLRIKIPLTKRQIRLFSNFLYSVSDSIMVFPTVENSFLKEAVDGDEDNKVLSQNKVNIYIEMIKNMAEEIETIGNGKAFVGMIPLIPVDYMKELYKLYRDLGINAFVIDAGTKDILGAKEFEYRMVVSEINSEIVPIDDAFIFASNLGIDLYEKTITPADDFLSIFAHVDIIGSSFKSKGFSKTPPKSYLPKAKVFSKEDYLYNISSYVDAEPILNLGKLNRLKVKGYNEKEQMIETNNLGVLIGELDMNKYLETKKIIKGNNGKLNMLKDLGKIKHK
jgi:hypothetical protein